MPARNSDSVDGEGDGANVDECILVQLVLLLLSLLMLLLQVLALMLSLLFLPLLLPLVVVRPPNNPHRSLWLPQSHPDCTSGMSATVEQYSKE